MKKIFILMAVLCLSAVLSFSVSAENNVSGIETEIIINDDGSADFHQVWHCNFTEGTEAFYYFNDEARYVISSFSVKQGDKTYTFADDWDTSLSFEEKKEKCGILDLSDGYELCWGISEYGEISYELFFTVDNLVTAFDEVDSTYFALFSEHLETVPTDIIISISLANGKELIDGITFDETGFSNGGNCAFFDYGYNGTAEIYDGAIVTITESPLGYDDFVAFKLDFEKGLISPDNYADISFYDYDMEYYSKYSPINSLFGIDEKEDNGDIDEYTLTLVVFGIIFVVFPALIYIIVRIVYKLIKKSKIGKPQINKNAPGMGIESAYIMCSAFGLCDKKALIALLLLDMIDKGAITPIAPESADSIPATKGNVRFRINEVDTIIFSEAEEKFYKFLKFSAKSDSILEPAEMVLKAQDNVHILHDIMDKHLSAAKKAMLTKGCWRSEKSIGPLFYTAVGTEELRKVIGYKKYLQEYSSNTSVDFYGYDNWQTPIKYAVLFGIAKSTSEELIKSYPTSDYKIREYYNINIIYAQGAAKLISDAMGHSERHSSRYGYTGTYTQSSYRYSRYSGGSSGGFRGGGGGFGGGSFGGGGGGRSGGGTR